MSRLRVSIRKERETVQAHIDIADRLHKAFDWLVNNGLLTIQEPTEQLSNLHRRTYISNMYHQKGEWKNELAARTDEAAIMDLDGLAVETVRKGFQLMDENAMLREWKGKSVSKGNQLYSDLEIWIGERLLANELTLNELEIDISNAEMSISDLERQRANVHIVQNEKSENVKILQDRISRINRWLETATILRNKAISISDTDSLLPVVSYVKKSINEVERLRSVIQDTINATDNEAKIQKLEQKLANDRTTIDRCKSALVTLRKLKPLSSYSEEFLAANIDQISGLFLSLHSPKEFQRLGLDSLGHLVAYRVVQGEDLPLSVHQMSTGQRTAVALAVFFILHLSMPTSPNFILLDEPVANMDDLNVLGLMDFLRSLASENGTQIVITTANPVVANLFRRKFSYLRQEFRDFKFIRFGHGTINCKVCTYDPHVEEPIIV